MKKLFLINDVDHVTADSRREAKDWYENGRFGPGVPVESIVRLRADFKVDMTDENEMPTGEEVPVKQLMDECAEPAIVCTKGDVAL